MIVSRGRKAVFFDRDGTLMREEDHCDAPERVFAMPGVAEALHALRMSGWLNIIITNQSGIGRGYFTVAQYEAVNRELMRQVGGAIDAAYFCPDLPDAATPRRKPGTGMVEEAARDWGIDPRASWFVGDKAMDVACGRAAGCRTILVRTGHGASQAADGADYVADDVVEAIRIILAEEVA
jgi:D-glycero-D-manno-heptose 1,7-bisphosphate phosphatase